MFILIASTLILLHIAVFIMTLLSFRIIVEEWKTFAEKSKLDLQKLMEKLKLRLSHNGWYTFLQRFSNVAVLTGVVITVFNMPDMGQNFNHMHRAYRGIFLGAGLAIINNFFLHIIGCKARNIYFAEETKLAAAKIADSNPPEEALRQFTTKIQKIIPSIDLMLTNVTNQTEDYITSLATRFEYLANCIDNINTGLHNIAGHNANFQNAWEKVLQTFNNDFSELHRILTLTTQAIHESVFAYQTSTNEVSEVMHSLNSTCQNLQNASDQISSGSKNFHRQLQSSLDISLAKGANAIYASAEQYQLAGETMVLATNRLKKSLDLAQGDRQLDFAADKMISSLIALTELLEYSKKICEQHRQFVIQADTGKTPILRKRSLQFLANVYCKYQTLSRKMLDYALVLQKILYRKTASCSRFMKNCVQKCKMRLKKMAGSSSPWRKKMHGGIKNWPSKMQQLINHYLKKWR